MRPFTLCYGLMTLSLGSLLIYGMANADDLKSPFGDTRVFAANAVAPSQPTVILPPIVERPAASESPASNPTDDAPTATLIPTVYAGMTADDVRAMLGEPDGISIDGTHWTYGSSVLIMNSGRLAGHVAFDPVQAALNKYNHMMSAIADTDDQTDVSSGTGAAAKRLTARKAARHVAKYRYSPIQAGSSRNAYRFNGTSDVEYSYYMNRYGPSDRFFGRKTAMPRGMTTSKDRSLNNTYNSRSRPTYGGFAR